MLELIAQGPRGEDRWRRTLPRETADLEIVVGRVAIGWSVAWDELVSRQHVRLRPTSAGVQVTKIDTARNPVFFKGQQRDQFSVSVGEHFVIGSTTFTLVQRPVTAASQDPTDLTQHAFDVQQLRRNPFRDAGQRIEVLSRLPDLISSSSSDAELWVRVATVLLQGIPGAAAVAVVASDTDPDTELKIHHYDSRVPRSDERMPSGTLVRKSVATKASVLHMWSGQREAEFTQRDGIDWAFCVPVVDAAEGLALYVAGGTSNCSPGSWSDQTAMAADGLQDDLKFAELVASTIGNLRNIRKLQQQQAGLRQFFAPVVMNALGSRGNEDTLAPREADLSVLFCDLRGFSRQSELAQGNLLDLLQRVSESLGVMTRHILDGGGVIGDFHGDSAMGFWGWPLAQLDAPARACQAAVHIQQEFATAASDGRLANFRCGIGIASGRAVAGRIGTVDQVKVTAFGPVVNLASRLEGMTKQLSAEILVDELSADFIRRHVGKDVCRVRRLARVLPAGISTPLVISQVLPPEGPLCSLTDAHIAAYEEALVALMDKRWETAFERLHDVPASDRAKDFLTVFIAQHGRIAPPDWNGVIALPKR